MSTPIWRLAFDLVERPLAAASESWVQSDQFMDMAARAVKLQRRLTAPAEQALDSWLRMWDLPTRRDMNALVNRVAALALHPRYLPAETGQRDVAPVPANGRSRTRVG
jgi:hypothetical protein